MRRPLGATERPAERLKGGGVGVVAVHIPQQIAQPAERLWIDSAVLHEALVCPRPKLFQVPARLGHTDYGNVQVAALQHGL
jgi:hypothetical protein